MARVYAVKYLTFRVATLQRKLRSLRRGIQDIGTILQKILSYREVEYLVKSMNRESLIGYSEILTLTPGRKHNLQTRPTLQTFGVCEVSCYGPDHTTTLHLQ